MHRKWLQKITLKTIPCFLLYGVVILRATFHPGPFWIGLTLLILGEFLRLWAAGHLSKNREVTVHGPYAYVKNPLYIGTLFVAVGFCAMASQWWGLAVVLIAFFFYYAPFKTRREASRLRRLYGETWDAYDQNVRDYLPRLSPYVAGAPARWKWEKVVSNSEHETAVVVFLSALFLGAYLWVG